MKLTKMFFTVFSMCVALFVTTNVQAQAPVSRKHKTETAKKEKPAADKEEVRVRRSGEDRVYRPSPETRRERTGDREANTRRERTSNREVEVRRERTDDRTRQERWEKAKKNKKAKKAKKGKKNKQFKEFKGRGHAYGRHRVDQARRSGELPNAPQARERVNTKREKRQGGRSNQ